MWRGGRIRSGMARQEAGVCKSPGSRPRMRGARRTLELRRFRRTIDTNYDSADGRLVFPRQQNECPGAPPVRLPWRWRFAGWTALAGGAILIAGTRFSEECYSCHVCRARKQTQTSSLLFWDAWSNERISYHGVAIPGHRHDWWRYSRRYSDGLGGCLGVGVACNADRYQDARIAP
jgi:hypothetical protein